MYEKEREERDKLRVAKAAGFKPGSPAELMSKSKSAYVSTINVDLSNMSEEDMEIAIDEDMRAYHAAVQEESAREETALRARFDHPDFEIFEDDYEDGIEINGSIGTLSYGSYSDRHSALGAHRSENCDFEPIDACADALGDTADAEDLMRGTDLQRSTLLRGPDAQGSYAAFNPEPTMAKT